MSYRLLFDYLRQRVEEEEDWRNYEATGGGTFPQAQPNIEASYIQTDIVICSVSDLSFWRSHPGVDLLVGDLRGRIRRTPSKIIIRIFRLPGGQGAHNAHHLIMPLLVRRSFLVEGGSRLIQ